MKINGAIKRNGAEGYFAASNTRRGFYSLYDEIYSERELKQVFIIKGGPGTGKSTMMDRIAERASCEKMHTDVYLCSSAPDSIDGIVINEIGVAVLDGTSPHTRDPVYPGVCGETVDLSRFWDSDRLRALRDEVTGLILAKAASYQRAYRYLSAAGEAYEDVVQGAKMFFCREKAEKAVKRLLDKHKLTQRELRNPIKHKFVGAVSTSGKCLLDTFEKKAEKICFVNEMYGAQTLFIDLLKNEAEQRGLKMTVVPNPVAPEYTNGIFFEDNGLYVSSEITNEIDADIINMKRFIDKNNLSLNRAKERMSEKMKSVLLDEALFSLSEAGCFHSETEQIYGCAMNFEGVQSATDEMIARIFG